MINLKIIGLCAGWYITTTVAALATKAFLAAGGDPIMMNTLLFAVGAIPFAWAFRQYPSERLVTPDLCYVALLHCCNNMLTSLGLEGSSIRVVYSVKALEPFCTSVFEIIFYRRLPDPRDALILTFIPVATYFALSGDTSVTFFGFFVSLFGTCTASARTVLFKDGLTDFQKSRPSVTFSVINFLSLVMAFPFTMIRPPSANISQGGRALALTILFTLSYNSLSFRVAALVQPIIHSVNNVMKRLLAVVAAQLWTRAPISSSNLAAILAIPALSCTLILSHRERPPSSPLAELPSLTSGTKVKLAGTKEFVLFLVGTVTLSMVAFSADTPIRQVLTGAGWPGLRSGEPALQALLKVPVLVSAT